MKSDDTRRLDELERANARLEKMVARFRSRCDTTVAEGNWAV
ncbi:hypothetical protein [Nocardia mangyaensis]|nr:hypothetical protein [Nocardia mangyaensis]MDO3646563.1 hypothetical protein [Nocardia mangyaensis]